LRSSESKATRPGRNHQMEMEKQRMESDQAWVQPPNGNGEAANAGRLGLARHTLQQDIR
jgi:hypothetical protein